MFERCGLFFFLTVLVFTGCGEKNNLSGNKQAPAFELESFQSESEYVKLGDWTENHYVLLAFWASWCPPCIKEIPLLNQLQKDYSEKGLKIFGINVSESRQSIEKTARKHVMEYDVLMDPAGETAADYGIEGLPVIVLLAKGGQIIYYGFSLPEIDDYLP